MTSIHAKQVKPGDWIITPRTGVSHRVVEVVDHSSFVAFHLDLTPGSLTLSHEQLVVRC